MRPPSPSSHGDQISCHQPPPTLKAEAAPLALLCAQGAGTVRAGSGLAQRAPAAAGLPLSRMSASLFAHQHLLCTAPFGLELEKYTLSSFQFHEVVFIRPGIYLG